MPSKRAALIAGAVGGRFMPPWKAEPGYGDFAGERRLTDAQIALIQGLGQSGRARRRSERQARSLPSSPMDGKAASRIKC